MIALYVGKLDKVGDVGYVLCPYCERATITELIEIRGDLKTLKCKVCENIYETKNPIFFKE